MDITVELITVAIETHNLCTRRCSYCKFGLERPWEKKWMHEDTFYKIIEDLKRAQYTNRIAFHNNNEPLMDKRLHEFIKFTRMNLPDSPIFFYTNGDLASEEVLKPMFDSGLSRISISDYDKNNYPKFRRLQKTFGEKRIRIQKSFEWNKIKKFHNRGGNIKSNIVSQKKYLHSGCEEPFKFATINPDGNMILCCCDFYYDVIFENVWNKPVTDIFYHNPRLNAIRKVLSSNSRLGLILCEKCSFHGRSTFTPTTVSNWTIFKKHVKAFMKSILT